MSEREKEWGGLVAGDTGPAMLSISAGKSRSQPPDKGTAGSRAAAAENHGGNHAVGIPEKQQQTFSPLGCSAPEAVLPSRGKKALCSRHSEPEPLQDHHDRTCVGAGELSSRSQSPKHLLEPRRHSSGKEALRNAHVQREHLTSDPAVTYIQDGGTKTDTWKTSGNSNETDILLGCLIDPSEVQNKNFRKDYAALDNSESTFTSPPRLFRCRRQNRVQSPDDPETNRTLPKPVHSLSDSNFPANLESCCKFYVDGRSLDISSDKLSVETDDPSSVFISSPTRNDEILQKLSSDRKRSSADRESVISVTTSDDRHSGSFELGGKKKKKTKNRFSNASEQDRSSLSLSVPASRGNSDTGAADDDTNRPPSSSSSTKGSHRRFAKRGLSGVFPSSNWRRLRNTLKAANEMQSNKKTKHALNREDSFLRKFSTRNHQNLQNSSLSADEDVQRYQNASKRFESRFVIQHDGNFMFYWLGVVTLSVLYNIWTPIAREAFKEIQEGCHVCWFFFDALFDLIYILDIVVQFRTGYLDQGLMVYDSKKLRDRYSKSKVIYIDFISLLPLDLVQIAIGIHPMMRFPRFLKVYRTFRFLHMMESRTAYPNLIRVANLTHILFLGAHWFAAFYYMISEAEDFKGDWAYPKPVGPFADVNRKYLRSLFWSTLTLTTIGDLPPPDNNNEYVFVIVSYLIGVFVFATIVGQVGNVINNRNASRQEFERLLDGAKIYMQTHNVPHNLQKRVQRWYDYVWSRGRLNGCDINSLGLLPDKLKTELAIHVNLETLKKVTIFQECQPEFLHDLVLKMKAYIFTPGDLICRRGEVAREMFIIADGVVEIISETGVMLKRMGAGDFFGEIGILNLDGGINRRTADVRSVGYLELFVLSREDVLEALKDHPEAESIIRDYGQRRLREVEAHRQRVKPLKCRGSTDQQGSFSNGSQTVQNRLLQTLRSLNPAVRRQSAQIINHISGSPPASTTTGNGPPSGNQRCVAQPCLKDSRVSRDCTPTSASPLAQVHTPVVLVDQPPADPAPIRAPARRRRSLGYLRTACVRFKHAFNRRRGRRRSLDDDGHRVQNQYMTKSLDDQSRHSDQSGNSSPLPQKCSIKLNIETCQDASRAGGDTSVDNSIEDNEIVTFKHVQEKMSIFGGIKRGSSLMQAYFEGESSHFGPKLTKGTHRKYSEPVAYMPVCTEDTDEPQSHPLQESDAEGEAPVTNALPAPYSLTVNNDEEASMTPSLTEQSNPLDLSATSSGYLASSHALSFTPQSRSSCSKSEENSSSLAASIQNEALGNYPVILSPSANIEAADAQPTSPDESFKSSFSIKSLPTRHSPTYVKSKNSSNTKHSPARIRKLINSSNPRVLSQSETQAENKVEAPLSVPASPVPCFKKASPSPFSLSCHCDPAENFSKFISKHLPDSFRQRLMKTNAYLAVQSPRLNNKYRTSSDSDAPENQKTLSPCGNHLALRSQSFPRLNDAETPTSRAVQRGQNSDSEVQFTFDAHDAEISPKLNRLKQTKEKSFERQGSGNGRSHAMSIIQTPASDLTYQNISAQIQQMQILVDKRLSQLEEVYMSTFSRLDKLAETQQTLERLIKQLLKQQKDQSDALGEEEEQLTASRV